MSVFYTGAKLHGSNLQLISYFAFAVPLNCLVKSDRLNMSVEFMGTQSLGLNRFLSWKSLSLLADAIFVGQYFYMV